MRSNACWLVLLLFLACTKSKNSSPDTTLIGSWHPEGTPDGRALTFEEDGDLMYSQWDAIRPYAFPRYRIADDEPLVFYGASSQGDRIVKCKIEGNVLSLEGACVESCSERMYKIGSL